MRESWILACMVAVLTVVGNLLLSQTRGWSLAVLTVIMFAVVFGVVFAGGTLRDRRK